MGILEELLKEVKLLNQNLRVTNTELSTVDPAVKNEVVKEAPPQKQEAPHQVEIETDEAESTISLTEVKKKASIYLKQDSANRAHLKNKLTELGVKKISDLAPEKYNELIEFLKG